MIEHIWSVLCNKSVVDSTTNNISLIDVIEELHVEVTIPSNFSNSNFNIPYELELITLWSNSKEKSEKDFFIKLNLIDPQGNVLKSSEEKLLYPKDKLRLRTIVKISGLELNEDGLYTFVTQKREEKENEYSTVSQIPLEIKIKRNIGEELAISQTT